MLKLKVVNKIPSDILKIEGYTYILPPQLTSIEDESCSEIDLGDVLDYVVNRLLAFDLCVNKLRPNGVIVLSGIDILEISKAVINGNITIEDINSLLYPHKQSVDNLYRVLAVIKNKNLKVLEKRLSGYQYYIKVSK